uniref:Uncharacterized protein n=1 Tax=Nelumbo nucifera TaxID=4432 RepID=A0A822XQY3_NELNU|nr:TPA_asm: hypothetical protein HUJ06_023546 [Nelumbo nucifera]
MVQERLKRSTGRVEPSDINLEQLMMTQVGVSRSKADKALTTVDDDGDDAIMKVP